MRPSSMLEARGDLSPVRSVAGRVQGCRERPNKKGLFDIRWLFNVTQPFSASSHGVNLYFARGRGHIQTQRPSHSMIRNTFIPSPVAQVPVLSGDKKIKIFDIVGWG